MILLIIISLLAIGVFACLVSSGRRDEAAERIKRGEE